MEESGISSAILESSEDKSSDSQGSSESLVGPQLCHDIILELGKYFDVQTIKSARQVNATWNKALETQFRTKLMLQVGFNFEMSVREFVKVFCPDTTIANSKLVTSSIWIKKSKYLHHPLMTKWFETYGDQLTTVTLGDSIPDMEDSLKSRERLFSPESMESILTRYCPNLKVLKILTPFISEHFTIKSINPDPNDVKVALDYLEIGNQDNENFELYLKSTFLFNILKCIKSVKSVMIVDLHSSRPQENESPEDIYAKKIFEDVEKLALQCCTIDPRRLFNLESPYLKFSNLQQLRIGCFCDHENGMSLLYLPILLTSVKDHLKELVLYNECFIDHVDMSYICPKIEDCILFPMPKLEVFQILNIVEWEASLDFLEKLPALKQLEITLHSFYSYKAENVEHIFDVNKSTTRIVHQNLEELTFKCVTHSSKQLENVRFCFPNLKKLEIDFQGTPVFSVFATFKKLKELRIHLFEPFESLDADDFEGFSGSVIEKLCLNRPDFKNLTSIVDGCLTSLSLQQLELKGMKISRKEYELAMEKLKTAKLQLWLINCEILDD